MATYNTSFGKAIKSINPEAQFVIVGEDIYESIKWLAGTPPISKADIEAKCEELDVSQAHIYPRANAFQHDLPIEEQLDKLFHDIDNGKFGDDAKSGLFFIGIQAIKDKYPKE